LAVVEGRWQDLDERLAELCRYAIKLTLDPQKITIADIDRLKGLGLDDRAIVDANQVASYFNYVNRVAHGLGVELESTWPPELRDRRSYALGPRYNDE